MQICLLLHAVTYTAACSHVSSIAPNTCPDGDFTLSQQGAYEVRLYSPDDPTNPSVWQGPLCAVNLETQAFCIKEYSLIKNIRLLGAESVLEVETFSGSVSGVSRLDLMLCEPAKP